MAEFLIDLIRMVAGVSFGALAFVFAVATCRAIFMGRDAYETNRSLSLGPLKALRGELRQDVVEDGRASHGLAFVLKSKALEEQRRLSAEAIEDVIGRRT